MASEELDGYDPSYRQADVDDMLDDHESRLSRLEKAALVAVGYVLGTASLSVHEIIEAAVAFL